MIHKYLFLPILVLLCGFLLFINLHYLEGIPHVPDSAAYLFMAKMFASGHIIQEIPVSPEHFDFFPGILVVDRGGTWFFQYTFGHPLLLTFGVLLGFPNIIPPLVGTLTIFFLFLIAKKLYSIPTAYFLLFLPFFSPFFLTNSASFMGHTSATFYLVLALFFLIKSLEKKDADFFGILSGVCIGLLFNTRPLTAVPFLLLFLFVYCLKKRWKIAIFYSFGFVVLLCLWLLYNFITSGSFTTSQYYQINKDIVGFDLQHITFAHLVKRFENVIILFQNLGPMLFGWPIFITYALLLFPVLFKKALFWDRIFFLALFTLPVTYYFYDGTFLMYGPRFWYEITPFVFFLVARSFGILFSQYKKISVLIFCILGGVAIGVLFSFIPTQEPDIMSPRKLASLKTFNYVDSRLLRIIKHANISNAVVFVSGCKGDWWCYGSVFPQNNPTLTTDIVYAKDLGAEKNEILKRYFPNRSFYLINYDTPILQKL